MDEEPTPIPESTPKELTLQAFEEWLLRMPPIIEGMPTQREYGEWLPQLKKWLQEAVSLAR